VRKQAGISRTSDEFLPRKFYQVLVTIGLDYAVNDRGECACDVVACYWAGKYVSVYEVTIMDEKGKQLCSGAFGQRDQNTPKSNDC
jgi:hypothetical protein